jgi:DNA-binding beta-propeller fold protein YncE
MLLCEALPGTAKYLASRRSTPMRPTFVFALLAGLAGLALAGDKPTFKKEKEITLPGSAYFDYLTVFEKRLYLAHGTAIDVVDLESGKKVGEVPGVDGAHGAVIVKAAGRGFATSGQKNKLVVFDLAKLTVTKEISVGKKPDAILWVATTGEVWTMNGKDGSISCVDPNSLEVKKSIEVGGKLESCVEDAAKGRVYVNVEDQAVVVQIDAKEHKVLNRYKLDGKDPTGLALDAKNGVLFCGCEKKLVFVDAATGKGLGSQEIADGCDGVAFDPASGCAFASCGESATTVVRESDGKTFELVARLETAPGARTCTIDGATHRVYIASSSKEDKSVKVLVFTPEK